MYSTRTRVHARFPNGHPREEKPDKSRRTSRRAERASRGRPRSPDTPTSARSEVGEEVRVGVGPVEFKLNQRKTGRRLQATCIEKLKLNMCGSFTVDT